MEKLVTIRTLDELTALRGYLADKDYVAYDTETTGLDKDSTIIGFSVCAEEELAFYVILHYWDTEKKQLLPLETTQQAKEVIQDLTGKNLIMHNALFDCWLTESNFKINLMPSVHTDTMILAHLLDENRKVGLKDLGTFYFGETATTEAKEMRASIIRNGGQITKANYELYKADADLIALYGAKDTILTLKIFNVMVPELFEQGLDSFFYDDECMPLLRGPTYDMNTTGLRVDTDALASLKGTLEAECLDDTAFIYKEIEPLVRDKYPGTNKCNTFNIAASQQLAWLLFERLENHFVALTDEGRALCKHFGIKLPYSYAAKREFIQTVQTHKGEVYNPGWNKKTKKMGKPRKIGDYWKYLAVGKKTFAQYRTRYKWLARIEEHAKKQKLLKTYVLGIQTRMKYGIVRPDFKQIGTTSGRYSCKNPNFQNLPRDDKRIKKCIIARHGKVFVGADYSQLEPRTFASMSQDPTLMKCFADGDDFYSVVGAPTFDVYNVPLKKSQRGSFAEKYPKLRDASKVFTLASVYGANAFQLAPTLDKTIDETQEIIERYFARFPDVKRFQLTSHALAKRDGQVTNLFGRPRRMPEAKGIAEIYGDTPYEELPYNIRNILNLAVNHRVQSTAASIMNRAAIAFCDDRDVRAKENPLWKEVKLVLQVHDQIVVECPKDLADVVVDLMRDKMQNTVTLPGVDLVADPSISTDLAGQK